jgi:hypothetical protein
MTINKADEIEQNNNPYKDTLLFHKIESMERKYNEQFQQVFKVCWLSIAQHIYKFDPVSNAHHTRLYQ